MTINTIFSNEIINIFLNNNNILHIEFLDVMDDITFKTFTIKIDEIFNKCKKNNNKFYLVLNFTKANNWNTTNLLYYINSTISYLESNTNNIENYLYGSLFIIEKNNIYTSLFSHILQNLYTPIKPVKYISPTDTINFSFIQSV